MRLNRLSLALAAIGLLSLSAGCGVQTFPLLDSSSSTIRAKSDTQADAVMQSVKTTWTGMNTASGVVSFWEKKGSQTSSSTANFYWSRPEKLRADITEASTSGKRGVKLVYQGDKKITAKLGFFKKTFSYDDPQVLSLRGYRIDQTDLGAFTTGLLAPGANVKYAGTTTISGRSADLLEVTGSKDLLPGTAKVLVAIDSVSHLPSQLEGFDNKEVVYRAQVPQLNVNAQLPGNIFDL